MNPPPAPAYPTRYWSAPRVPGLVTEETTVQVRVPSPSVVVVVDVVVVIVVMGIFFWALDLGLGALMHAVTAKGD